MNQVDFVQQPTPVQRHLLRAAHLSGSVAIAAWEAWRSHVDLAGPVDAGTFRLLPQLYRNLHRLGVDDPLVGRLKGVYRQTWYKNQLLLGGAMPALSALHRAGADALLLDGAALALLCTPPDFGLYGLNEVAVLVHTSHAVPAIRSLQPLGWRLEWFPAGARLEEITDVAGSQLLQDGDGNRLRLCWRLLAAAQPPTASDDPFAGARAAQLHGLPVRTLEPTDLLLTACVQPTMIQPVPLLQRVADALLVLAVAGDAIQWERLIDQTQRRHLTAPVVHVLGYIQDNLDAPLPAPAVERIRALPITAREQAEVGAATDTATLLGRLPALWYDYARVSPRSGGFRRVVGFPRYLQHAWHLDQLWQVPVRAARQGARRLVGRRT